MDELPICALFAGLLLAACASAPCPRSAPTPSVPSRSALNCSELHLTRAQARELGFSDEVLTRMAVEIPDPRETMISRVRARTEQPELIGVEVSADGRVLRGVSTDPAAAQVGCQYLYEEANRFARELAVTALPLLEQEVRVLATVSEGLQAALEPEAEYGTAEERADRRSRIEAEVSRVTERLTETRIRRIEAGLRSERPLLIDAECGLPQRCTHD